MIFCKISKISKDLYERFMSQNSVKISQNSEIKPPWTNRVRSPLSGLQNDQLVELGPSEDDQSHSWDPGSRSFAKKSKFWIKNTISSKSKLRFSWQAIMKMCFWNVEFNNYENWIIGAEADSYLTLMSPHSANYKNIYFLSGRSWVKKDGQWGWNWNKTTWKHVANRETEELRKWTVLK